MFLLFNMLSRLVIAFLSQSKRLLISWLQSPYAVILEPKKIKSVSVSMVPHLFAMKWCLGAMVFGFWMLSFFLINLFLNLFIYFFSFSSFFNLILFLNFTVFYLFCHISKWICHRHIRVPHPEPSSLPIPSLWVVPVPQPQASSIVHRTWTGDSFHIWYYT